MRMHRIGISLGKGAETWYSLRGAMTHYSMACALDNRNSTSYATVIPYHVPILVDRVRVAVLACGKGSIYILNPNLSTTLGPSENIDAVSWGGSDTIELEVDTTIKTDATDEPLITNTGEGIQALQLVISDESDSFTVSNSINTSHLFDYLLGYTSADVTCSAVILLFDRDDTDLTDAF